MDRLTQLQQCVDKMSQIYYTSIGILQRDAPLAQVHPDFPVTCWTSQQLLDNQKANAELAQNAAKDLVETAKIADFIIDNLPGLSSSENEQFDRLNALQAESEEEGNRLKDAISKAQDLQLQLNETLDRILLQELTAFKI